MLSLAADPGFSFADEYALGLVFAAVALFVAIGALSQQHERAYSAAVIYLLLGTVASVLLQLLGVELIDPLEDAKLIERLGEIAVIVALFSAGLKIDRPLAWGPWRSVTALLVVTMPLTIAGIALFGTLVMGLSLGAAVILGAVLAPTDPVLAGDVQVGPPGEEDEPEPQLALTGEAGFNDGLAFPFVFLGVFIASEGGTGWLGEWLLADVLYAVAVGVALGVLGGRLIAALILRLHERDLLLRGLDGWVAIATLLLVYGVAEVAGAYGFLAVFAAGLAFRRYEHDHEYNANIHDGTEQVEKFAELLLVLVLGSLVTVSGLGEPGLSGWLLVPVLLLVIRPLAVLAGFVRSSVPVRERLFIGWFGIRGIGSLYYVAVVLGSGALSDSEGTTVFWTVLACVGVSIVAHGISASPVNRWVAARRD